ncbi:HAD family hydrolase [Pedobacter cryoconitis]|uniref:HAD superfamily hydrolase (TIGR01509 family)/HAD superfamily hydrolase (TIGR01549 family) n=1 Tax=Pedobacter cryoconitis TaxID=188932 RepID=A0A327SVB1_9SPHI|nr:HAD family phosphatase [Pedobacter cryoconitis]RAJ29557.1 HAD superfamily hydrolase (TIGR01509 family)/HAD superfamily hydrolase (TIGR01549 family) [Pedobacter cryoconitis]
MEETNFSRLSKLTEGDYEAFLYDCDGTLADNMPAHTETYVAIAKQYNVDMDPAIIDELAGWPILNVVEELNLRYQADMDPAEFTARKAKLYFEEYLQKALPITYVVEHLKANAGKVRIAVVSGGDRRAVQHTLDVVGVSDYVEAMVCAGETPRGKPFADPFLKAAELLGVDPKKCLVFEDGKPGTDAAEAAGMHWVRIDQFKFG